MTLLCETQAALESSCAEIEAEVDRLVTAETDLKRLAEKANEKSKLRKQYTTKVARLEAAKENLRIEIAELRHDEKQAKVQQRIRAAKEKMFSSESSMNAAGEDVIMDPQSSDSDDFE